MPWRVSTLTLFWKQTTASDDPTNGLDERRNPASHILRQKSVWLWAKGGHRSGQWEIGPTVPDSHGARKYYIWEVGLAVTDSHGAHKYYIYQHYQN